MVSEKRIQLQSECHKLRQECLKSGFIHSCRQFRLNACDADLKSTAEKLRTIQTSYSSKKGYAQHTKAREQEFVRRFVTGRHLTVSTDANEGRNHVYWRTAGENEARSNWINTTLAKTFGEKRVKEMKMNDSNTFLVNHYEPVLKSFKVAVEYLPSKKQMEKRYGNVIKETEKKRGRNTKIRAIFVVRSDVVPLKTFSPKLVRTLLSQFLQSMGADDLYSHFIPVYVHLWNRSAWLMSDCYEITNRSKPVNLEFVIQNVGESVTMQLDLPSLHSPCPPGGGDDPKRPECKVPPPEHVTALEKLDLKYVKDQNVRLALQRLLNHILLNKNLPRNHSAFRFMVLAAQTRDDRTGLDQLFLAGLLFLALYHPRKPQDLENVFTDHIRQHLGYTPDCVEIHPSGLATLNSVLPNLQASQTELLVIGNVYFEFIDRIDQMYTADVDKRVKIEAGYRKVDFEKKFLWEKARVSKKREPSQPKVGAFFSDLSWGTNLDFHDYPEVDVAWWVQTMLRNDWLEKGGLVIVDITIDTVFSENLHQFMKDIHPLVKSGTIELVLISSLQKLYQFGIDKMSGGFMARFTSESSTSESKGSKRPRCIPSHRLPDLNLTGYTFFVEHASDLIQSYVNRYHRNNRLLYDALRGYVSVVPPKIKLISVDFVDKDGKYADEISPPETENQKVDIDYRASWGFRNSIIFEIESRKTRICVGASATEEEVDKLVQVVKTTLKKEIM